MREGVDVWGFKVCVSHDKASGEFHCASCFARVTSRRRDLDLRYLGISATSHRACIYTYVQRRKCNATIAESRAPVAWSRTNREHEASGHRVSLLRLPRDRTPPPTARVNVQIAIGKATRTFLLLPLRAPLLPQWNFPCRLRSRDSCAWLLFHLCSRCADHCFNVPFRKCSAAAEYCSESQSFRKIKLARYLQSALDGKTEIERMAWRIALVRYIV